MRKVVLGEEQDEANFYPVELIQLSTLGVIHNLTPLAQEKLIPQIEGGPEEHLVPIYRFYFDGLIVHFRRNADDNIEPLGSLILGATDTFHVSTIPYEVSFQRENLEMVSLRYGLEMPPIGWG